MQPHNTKIIRYASGVQIVPANQQAHTFASLLNLPISVWLVDQNGATIAINTEGAQVCGFDSPDSAIGLSLEAVADQKSAVPLIENCKKVLHDGTMGIYEELHVRKDGLKYPFLSIKLPCFNIKKEIIGVFGFSIVVGKHPLADSLAYLANMGFIGPNAQPPLADQFNLSTREKQCLQFLRRGYTAKMIARELSISFRTVESYLVTLKQKLGVSSKNDLVKILY